MLKTKILPGEFWWGGMAVRGTEMPFGADSDTTVDLIRSTSITGRDQCAALFVSCKGRYIWSNDPYVIRFSKGTITVDCRSEVILRDGFGTLKGAYLAAMKSHFPFDGRTPDSLFFTKPQYNTWIELNVYQNQEDVLKYAHGIIDNGFPAGVLMIDGGWQQDYGRYHFDLTKFPDPRAMTDELHKMGFRVMVWASPIVACSGRHYKDIRDKGWLIKDSTGEIAIRKWWSGFSAVLDLSNPEAAAWLDSEFAELHDIYGVDGYKMDAGDPYFYRDDDINYGHLTAHQQVTEFCRFGTKYPFNEYRSTWNAGGLPLVARLHDKAHSWTEGINMIAPDTIVQGLLGYPYCCPDMIGGGDEQYFNDNALLDREMVVRWAEASALTPMMQFSVAPWRILSGKELEAVRGAALLHEQFGEYIFSLARHSAKTGEPIARAMDYEYPDCGFEEINDQYMLGSEILVAPVTQKGAVTRTIRFPEGEWSGDDGSVVRGPQTLTVEAPLERLPYYKKIG
jgi:alpha-glucosidase (family GH31 glycosyl hydrolase)